MDHRIMLAVAGSGKTYHICNSLNPDKRNLIIAYTNENVANIKRELINKFNKIPRNTKITTFDKFVYNSLVLPYEMTIKKYSGDPIFSVKEYL